jgi:predicted Zn-dependent protease
MIQIVLAGVLLVGPGIDAVRSSGAVAQRTADAIPALEKAVADRPADLDSWRMLASAYTSAGRRTEALSAWRTITDLAPKAPPAWYGLAQAYNDVKQEALGTFAGRQDEEAWRQLLSADALEARDQSVDAFVLYRVVLERLPSMVSIHDSIARIYEETGHKDWAARERARGSSVAVDCAARRAICEYRAGRHREALEATQSAQDPESRYWRARAASDLALAAYKRLDELPDSRERRAFRAAQARADERFTDAVTELEAALAFVPGDMALTYELASACYSARDYERALATLSPLVKARPDDARLVRMSGLALLQMRRLDEALPLLRQAVAREPGDTAARLALGRALVQNGSYAEAIPLVEPQLSSDADGSLHVQLARAYANVGQREKADGLLARSRELQQAADARAAAAARRTITPPK